MTLLYSQIRDTLRTGDLVSWNNVRINSFFSLILKLYQKILKPKSTHVGIIANIGKRIFVIEARPPCIRIYPLSLLDDFYLVRTNIKEEDINLDYLFKKIGVPYGIFDLIGGILQLSNSSKAIYCSELCNLYYTEIKYLDDKKYKNAGRIPDTLLDAICEISGNEPVYVKIDRGNLNAI